VKHCQQRKGLHSIDKLWSRYLLAFIRFSLVKAITTTTKRRGHLRVN